MDERNFTYMFYGLAAAWATIVLYVLTLVTRENKLKIEVETLKNLIKERKV